MKKIKLLIIPTMILILTTGCNKQIVDFNYTFNEAICNIGGEYKTIEIKQWKDYEDGEQLQIKDKDGNTYLVSSVNCTLIG